MAYVLSEDKRILTNGSVAILKAADATGQQILEQILNFSKGENYQVLPLKYNETQKVWLNTKDKYLLFNLSTDNSGKKLVDSYLSNFDNQNKPQEDTQMVVVEGALLSTDENAILINDQGNLVDMPNQNVEAQKKLSKV